MDGWSCTENLNFTSESGEDGEITLSNNSMSLQNLDLIQTWLFQYIY